MGNTLDHCVPKKERLDGFKPERKSISISFIFIGVLKSIGISKDQARINRFARKCKALDKYKVGIRHSKKDKLDVLNRAFEDFKFSNDPIEKYWKFTEILGKIIRISYLKSENPVK